MTVDELKIRIESFSELEKNWDSYGAEEIHIQSIVNASELLDHLVKIVDQHTICAFPMRDGGVQLEIGDYWEIEVFRHTITDIKYDKNYDIIREYIYLGIEQYIKNQEYVKI